MPQATDELRAEWPGSDNQATAHLEAKGYTLEKDWTWTLPCKGFQVTARDMSAVTYLVIEWDFGGFSTKEPPETFEYKKPRHHEGTQYCLALLSEEAAEVIKLAAGKSFRFGHYQPGRMMEDGEPDLDFTPQVMLQSEVGDFLAAVEFSFLHGVLSRNSVMTAKEEKLDKLLNGVDNTGRKLAPPIPVNRSLQGNELDFFSDSDDNQKKLDDLNLGWIGRQWRKVKSKFTSRPEVDF